MKRTRKYYFTVEGETEQWYLEWLQKRINEVTEAEYKVSFDCQIQQNPLKRAKSLTITGKTEVWHLSDYESEETVHVQQFKNTMDQMKEAMSLGKQITYRFAYSNLTFDLWIILHKMDCNTSYIHRKNYIHSINRAYGEWFEDMKDFKHEDNFKRCLGKLSLKNVMDAVDRADKIMQRNQDNGYSIHKYKGFQYYKENPSLEVHTIIRKILCECSL